MFFIGITWDKNKTTKLLSPRDALRCFLHLRAPITEAMENVQTIADQTGLNVARILPLVSPFFSPDFAPLRFRYYYARAI